MPHFPAPNRRSSHDQIAIGHSLTDGGEYARVGEEFGGADGGARFAEGWLIGIDETEVEETEVAHRASGGADVEGVARSDENDAEMVEVRLSGQDS
jgi:hypothetical protein